MIEASTTIAENHHNYFATKQKEFYIGFKWKYNFLFVYIQLLLVVVNGPPTSSIIPWAN